MSDYAPLLEYDVEIAAPPSQVWALISDVTRMSEWSPQVMSTRLRKGFDEVALGTEFTNRNHEGELEWVTHAEIVAIEPERTIGFRIAENWVIWSFTLEPTMDGGTRLIQRRDVPDGISGLSRELTDGFLGGQAAFTETLRAGMKETLAAIKRTAEGSI